jgi:predicted nucleotidyltransferase
VDLQHPLSVISPTLDGDVLGLLGGGQLRLTGREIGRRISASQEGVRRVLDRLVEQGIVLREQVGRAHLFCLNRDHVAADAIEHLATLRLEVISRLRGQVAAWKLPPVAAILFGSSARGDSRVTSDLDILIVRPRALDGERPEWRQQITDLVGYASRLTGNDTRIVEYSETEVRRVRKQDRLLANIEREGIDLFGSLNRAGQRKGKAR